VPRKSALRRRKKNSYIEKLNEQYEAKLKQGKDGKEAFYELAMEECESIPSERDTKAEKAWFAMMGGAPPSRICDKPKAFTGEDGHIMAPKAFKGDQVPTWVVAVSASAAVVGIVIAVIVVVIVVKKRKAPQDNLYVDLMSNQN